MISGLMIFMAKPVPMPDMHFNWSAGALGRESFNLTNPLSVPLILTLGAWTHPEWFSWDGVVSITVAAGATVAVHALAIGRAAEGGRTATAVLTYAWGPSSVTRTAYAAEDSF